MPSFLQFDSRMFFIYYYYYLLSLCGLFNLALGKYCQLSGYNLESQFFSFNDSIHNEYHLILCIDGKFIFDTKWTEIPWSQLFKFADKTLIISRTRRYALKSLPIYLPNIEFGGIFDISDNGADPIPISPLVSVPITDYWVEIRHDGLFVYHLPLLGTPTIINDSWQAGILVNEDYHYNNTDHENTLESSSLINNQLYSRLVDLLIFLKRLPSASYKNFLYNLNKLLT